MTFNTMCPRGLDPFIKTSWTYSICLPPQKNLIVNEHEKKTTNTHFGQNHFLCSKQFRENGVNVAVIYNLLSSDLSRV